MKKGLLVLFIITLMILGCSAMDNAIVNTDSMKNVMRSLTVQSLKSDIAPEDIAITPGESSLSGTKWVATFPSGKRYRCNKMSSNTDAYCIEIKNGK